MLLLELLITIFGIVFFALAALNTQAKLNWMAAGLLCWFLLYVLPILERIPRT